MGKRGYLKLAGAALAALLLFTVLPGDDPSRTPAPSDSPPEDKAPPGTGSLPSSPEPHRAAGSSLLTGTVRRAGQSVAARLEIRPAKDGHGVFPSGGGEDGPVALAKAEDDGRFRVGGLATGWFEVLARAPDGATGARRARIREPGAHVDVTVAIPAGKETLRGRLVRNDGTPFVGHVAALSRALYGRPWHGSLPVGGRAVKTDSEGRFAIPGMEPGYYSIWISDGPRLAIAGPSVSVPAGEQRIVVDERLLPLEGRVLSPDGKTGVAGARITARWGWRDDSSAGAVSGPDGTFRLLGPRTYMVAVNTFEVTVRAKGNAKWTATLKPPATRIEVRLLPAAGVRGRVADRSGAAIAGLPVFAVVPGPPPRVRGRPWETPARDVHRTRTGPDGRFAFEGLPAGEVIVYARGKGYVSPGLAEAREHGANALGLRIDPGEVRDVDLPVVPAGGIAGTVLDAGGAPVSGASLSAEPDISGIAGFGDVPPWLEARAASGAGGHYRLDGLVPGLSYRVTATAPDRPQVVSQPVAVEPGSAAPLDLRFAEGYRVRVRVTEKSTRAPLAGAFLNTSDVKGWAVPLGVTAENGVALLGPFASPGVRVGVSHPDCLRQVGKEVPDEGGAVRELDFELERGLAIEGRVQFPDGSPVTAGRIRTRSHGDRGSVSQVHSIGPDGTFRVAPLPPESYRLMVWLSRDGETWFLETTAEAGSTGHVFTLEPREAETFEPLTIRIFGPDGLPVSTAAIRFSEHQSLDAPGGVLDMRVYDSQEGDDSRFLLHGARDAEGRPLGSAVIGPLRPGKLDVTLPASRAIAGVVTDPDGAPVAGVLVRAFAVYPGSERIRKRDRKPTAQARTDGEGRFRVVGLGEGEFLVALRAPLGLKPPPEAQFASGTEDLSIRLERSATAVLTFLDWRGDPLPGVRVSVYAGDEDPPTRLTTESGPDGIARIAGLDPNVKYWNSYSAPAGRSDLSPVTISDQGFAPADKTVRFERGWSIRGTVVDLAGRPLAGAVVEKHDGKSYWRSAARSGSDGTFEIRGIAEGAYRLRAKNFKSSAGEEVEAVAGDEGVVLRLDRRADLRLRITNWNREYEASVLLTQEGEKARWERVDPDGVVLFENLPAAKPAILYAREANEGLFVLLTGVDVSAGQVEAALVPGRRVAGRLLLPARAARASASVHGPGVSASTEVPVSDGRFEVRGLPPGDYRLSAYWGTGPEEQEDGGSKTVDVTAGQTVEIDLR